MIVFFRSVVNLENDTWSLVEVRRQRKKPKVTIFVSSTRGYFGRWPGLSCENRLRTMKVGCVSCLECVDYEDPAKTREFEACPTA